MTTIARRFDDGVQKWGNVNKTMGTAQPANRTRHGTNNTTCPHPRPASQTNKEAQQAYNTHEANNSPSLLAKANSQSHLAQPEIICLVWFISSVVS